jgi:hypothetical protein
VKGSNDIYAEFQFIVLLCPFQVSIVFLGDLFWVQPFAVVLGDIADAEGQAGTQL